MNKILNSTRKVRFRRYCHKAYAAFASLHREVTIGRLATYITDRAMILQGRCVAVVSLLLMAQFSVEASDEPNPIDDPQQLSLQEVLVVSEKAEVESKSYRLITQMDSAQLKALPTVTVADILQYLPGVDVRTRGANGSQADISMRGGTFDQVLVMLNGVPLVDSQTGHYTLAIPLPVELIDRIEVLQGTSASQYGAYSGAINIRTRAHAKDVQFRLTGGMNGLFSPAFATQWEGKDWFIQSGIEYTRSDGYYAPSPSEKEQKALTNSDLQLANLYLRSTWRGLDIQAGIQYKDAGAGSFYGFGSQDQFDATRTIFGSVSYNHRWGAWSLDGMLSYRANYDRYEWHRGQRKYGNFHFTQTAMASLAGHYASSIGTTTVGIQLRNDNIHSTNLGDTLYADGQVPNLEGFDVKSIDVLHLVKGANRLNVHYYAEQTFHYEDFSASLGASGEYNTQFGNNYSLSMNVGYSYAKTGSVYVNTSRALRLPTFLDMYYDAGNQLGSRDLKPETAWMLSAGTQYSHSFDHAGRIGVQGDIYYRWGRNTIDWVYTPTDTKRPYHATNQQQVNAFGLELMADYHWNEWIKRVSVSYAYALLDLDLKEKGSRYLDYLSHKLVINLEHGIYKGFGAQWSLRYQKREGQYNNADGEVCDYSPVLLLDGSVYWQNEHVRISADVTNMTNRHYYDYGGILQSGAWAKLTIVTKF